MEVAIEARCCQEHRVWDPECTAPGPGTGRTTTPQLPYQAQNAALLHFLAAPIEDLVENNLSSPSIVVAQLSIVIYVAFQDLPFPFQTPKLSFHLSSTFVLTERLIRLSPFSVRDAPAYFSLWTFFPLVYLPPAHRGGTLRLPINTSVLYQRILSFLRTLCQRN